MLNLQSVILEDISRPEWKPYVVHGIWAPISNQEIDRAKRFYAHLKKIDLAYSNHGNEEMEIQLLIGEGYMWSFSKGEIARG
jgi:predicted enzyme related to lactoylglutathione lyase